MKNLVIKHFDAYNARRYSTPWVCAMTDRGTFDFASGVGTYTGNGREGGEGDLVIFAPQEGKVYGYGQKDYNAKNTWKMFVKFDGEKLVPCDKIGKEI